MRPTCGLLLKENNGAGLPLYFTVCSAKHINKAANRMRQFRIIKWNVRNACKEEDLKRKS